MKIIKMIGIIDYELGNTQSVETCIKNLNFNYRLCKNPIEINNCSHVILPGVGSFASTMNNLKKLNFIPSLSENILKKKKFFLGICVGFQILFEKGLENKETSGLGWLKGTCQNLNVFNNLALTPHSGWNEIENFNEMKLFDGIDKNDKNFYFLHSYLINDLEKKENLKFSKTFYDDINFISSIEYENIYGSQFHPEKSQKNGKIFLENFCNL